VKTKITAFRLPFIWKLQSGLNSKCTNHLFITINHIVKGSKWALQMLDSSTKVPAGLLEGNVFDLGNFDECINVDVTEDTNSFKGQHCLATVNWQEKEASSFTWSMCVPSTCTAHDLEVLLINTFNYTVDVSPATCHTKQTKPFTPEDSLAIYVLSLFGLLCVLSTVYDIKVTNSGKKKDILRAFSWYTNGKKLLKIRSSSDEKMKCLPGLKFLSIMWIIIGHSYFMQGTIPATNMNTYRKALSGWDHFPVGISIFSVESFFLMSGLLVGNTFFKTTEEVCERGVYLAVDTQLYILSSLFLIPLLKRPSFWTKNPLCSYDNINYYFIPSVIHNNVTFGFQAERRHEFPEYFYTHIRAISWLIGLYLSFFLHKTKLWRQHFKQWNETGLTKKYTQIGWILGLMCLILPLVWTHRFSQTNFIPSSLEFSFYFTLSRPLWCIGISWLIFACMTGNGGPVNRILSWEILQPLSRLTYCIYIIYFPFLLVRNSSIKNASDFTDYKQIHRILGTMVYVILLAIPTYLTFEAPVFALFKTSSDDTQEKTAN
ncbi:hypothetical protein L9F63_026800, partial [Diploptera punctata]